MLENLLQPDAFIAIPFCTALFTFQYFRDYQIQAVVLKLIDS